jgi:hypothetical protein
LYCNLLRNHLRPAIRSKHHGLLSTGVLLLHDSRPPTARVTAGTVRVILSVSVICHTHLTSPLVNAMFLGCPTRLLVERLSDLMKKCKRQCINGYACNQRISPHKETRH